jgi:hypothetical protein
MKEFMSSPLGKKLSVLLVAGVAAALARYLPDFEKYIDLAAAFMAGSAIVRSPGDVAAPKPEAV